MPDVALHDALVRRFTVDVTLHEVRIAFAHLPVYLGEDDDRCEYWSYAGEMVVSDVTSSKVDLRSDEGWIVDSTIEDENGVEIAATTLQQERRVRKIALGFADGSSAVIVAGRAVIYVGAPIHFVQIEPFTRPGRAKASSP